MTWNRSRFGIWFAGVSFVLLQFFLQLSSGVVIGAIMRDMHLSALVAGVLSSSLYFMYTGLQIPVGILFDRKNTRTLLTSTVFICSLGCLAFASSHHLAGLFIGRSMIGMGSAFAFVGFSHLARQHFPPKQFAFLMGFSETLAFIVTVMAMISMGTLLHIWGWRYFIVGTGVIGLFITWLCWRNIPNGSPQTELPPNYGQQLLQIIQNGRAWINGLFVGFSFIIITVFGALWAIPFLQMKLNCTLQEATLLNALFFLGAGVSCPLLGVLSSYVKQRKRLIFASCLSTSLLLFGLLFIPTTSHWMIGGLMFAIGCCCGAYMLAFTIANELAPKGSLSTCTGFTNTLAVITAPIMQTLIGYFLDLVNPNHQYTLSSYQIALLIIPVSLLIASLLVIFLPEKKSGKR